MHAAFSQYIGDYTLKSICQLPVINMDLPASTTARALRLLWSETIPRSKKPSDCGARGGESNCCLLFLAAPALRLHRRVYQIMSQRPHAVRTTGFDAFVVPDVRRRPRLVALGRQPPRTAVMGTVCGENLERS